MKILDFLSLFLSGIGILQNIHYNQSPASKIEGLKDALDKIDSLYELLGHAKEFHDQFENFETISLEMSIQELHDTSMENRKKDILTNLISYHDQLIVYKAVPEFSLVDKSISMREVTSHIKSCCQLLTDTYPEYKSSINSFKGAIEELKELINRKNYGDDMTSCLTFIKDQVARVRKSADTLILNLCPLLEVTHLELKGALIK